MELTGIEYRIRDCSTYNFGMRNADLLAKQDAPAMHKALLAVKNLHSPKRHHTFIWDKYEDRWDSTKTPLGEEVYDICSGDGQQYPCETIRAMAEEGS